MTRYLLILVVASILATPAGALVGGRDAQPGDAPWMVAIINTAKPVSAECLDSGGSTTFCQQVCGGTLIAPGWVLTAAHCLINTPYQDLRVLTGVTDLNASGLVDQYLVVSDAQIHPDAPVEIETYYRNDIALLRLASPAATTPASIITLESLVALEQNDPVADDGVTVFGWGQLGPEGAFPARLQRVSMEMPPAACSSAWAIAPWDYDIWACSVESDAMAVEADDAGDPSPLDAEGEGICVLDSGGPLLAGDTRHGMLAGIVSWGQQDECGNAAYPTVHTRVPYFLSWIESATQEAGAALTDTGLAITAPASAAPGDTPAIVVTLRNGSLSTDVPAPSFSVRVTGTAQLALSGNALTSCTAVSGGWDCHYTGGSTLPAESDATVTFTASATAAGQALLVEAALTGHDSGADYRRHNDQAAHRLAFTGSPDLQLSASGVADGSSTAGWILATVANASGHADASGVVLELALPRGIVFAGAAFVTGGALSCSGSTVVTCQAGDIPSGQERQVRIAVNGSADYSGYTTLHAEAVEGDFPTLADGLSDTDADVLLTWGTPSQPPARPGTGGGGGGGAGGLPWLVAVLLLGWRWRRRPAVTAR